MITLIRKIFIKDYLNVNDAKVRTSHGILASVGGIVINLILFTIKLLIGLISFSMSIVSDAINNLSDMFSCFVNLIGFKIANKPADKKHPFGHQRIEYIAGMIVSFFIVAIAIILAYTSIQKLINAEANQSYDLLSFIILGISILFKILLGLFYKGLGKAINSVTLKASATDSINDVICTTCILIASIFQAIFKENVWFLDSVMSICVSLFILYSGIKMIIETSQPLIGTPIDHDFLEKIVKDITSYDGILGIHDLIAHNYGPTKIFISVHAEVDGYQNIMEIHDLIDNIEEDISLKYGIEITIHMDPLDTKNKDIPILKQQLTSILNKYDASIKFHDFRMVSGDSHTNLVFDVVVPNNRKIDKLSLTNYIKNEFKNINKKYNCVIKVDEDYTSEIE